MSPGRLLALELIFGVDSLELLTDLRDQVEDKLGLTALKLFQRLENHTDAASKKKLKLLEEVLQRVRKV